MLIMIMLIVKLIPKIMKVKFLCESVQLPSWTRQQQQEVQHVDHRGANQPNTPLVENGRDGIE